MKMAVFWVVAPCRLVSLYDATTQKTAIFKVTILIIYDTILFKIYTSELILNKIVL
jgi:hypothetical protein